MEFPMNKKLLSAAIVASLSIGLTACHDDDDTSAPIEPIQTTITLDGVATKGAIIGADVFACEAGTACVDAADPTGSVGLLGSSLVADSAGTQAPDGSYQLTIDAGEEAVTAAVVVRVIPTATTTQVCDFEGCDADTVTELKTVTVVDVAPGTSTTVETPVSVLSTIATEVFEAETAGEEAGLVAADADTLTNLLDTVSETVATVLNIDTTIDLFEVEVVSATAENIADADTSDDVKELSLLNATLGSITDGATNNPDTSASIATVVTAVTTGTAAAANDLITEVNTQTQANIDDAAITVPDTVDTTVEEVTGDLVLPTIPDVNEDGTTGASSGNGSL